MTQASDGSFYGVSLYTSTPIFDLGAVYRMKSGHVTVLHDFAGNQMDPGVSLTEPVQASDGNLYGLTGYYQNVGGASLFRIDPTGGYAVVHLFDYSEGWIFAAPVVQGSNGQLYFTALEGSTYGFGAILSSTLDGEVQIVYAFTGGVDGAGPESLILASDGYFYGTTNGGASGSTIFRMSSEGVVQTLADLDASGCRPSPFRLVDFDDSLYGLCEDLGNGGGIFKYSLQRAEFSIVHSFVRNSGDGDNPQGGLIADLESRKLFGTTCTGGKHLGGTIFEFSGDGTGYRELASFKESHCPAGNLFLSQDGYIYGTTQDGGGKTHQGTIYRFRP